MSPSRARALALALVLTLSVLACGADDRPVTARSSTAPTSSSEPEPEPEPEPGRPAAGECRGATGWDVYMARSDERAPVPCDGPHGAETYSVGDLPEALSDLSAAETASGTPGHERIREAVSERCDAALHRAAGTDPEADVVRLTRVVRAFFLPTFEQWERGARWFRCELILPPEGTKDAPEEPRTTTVSLVDLPTMESIPAEVGSCTLDGSDLHLGCDRPHHIERLVSYIDRNDAAAGYRGDELYTYAVDTYRERCREDFLRFTAQSPGEERSDITFQTTWPGEEGAGRAVGPVRGAHDGGVRPPGRLARGHRPPCAPSSAAAVAAPVPGGHGRLSRVGGPRPFGGPRRARWPLRWRR